MKIFYNKEVGVNIHFGVTEIKFALQLLKALQSVIGAGFIREAIEDIEYDLKPKLIPFINYHHICNKCFMMIDERKDSFIHHTGGKDVWIHQVCKELKTNRPN